MKMAIAKTLKKKYIHRHKDGTIWARGFMTKGKMDGRWVWFRKDGSLMRSGSFKLGAQVGKWTTYTKKGEVVKVTIMKPA